MYPQSFWLFDFKLQKILKHFKQIRSHLKDYIKLSSTPSEAVLRMFFMQALLLSPRAHFLSPRASFFVSPSASEGSPCETPPQTKWGMPRYSWHYRGRGMTGCGDFSLRSKRQKRALAPSPLFCRPEAQAEGVPQRLRASGRHPGTPSRTKWGMPRYRSGGRSRELFETSFIPSWQILMENYFNWKSVARSL